MALICRFREHFPPAIHRPDEEVQQTILIDWAIGSVGGAAWLMRRHQAIAVVNEVSDLWCSGRFLYKR